MGSNSQPDPAVAGPAERLHEPQVRVAVVDEPALTRFSRRFTEPAEGVEDREQCQRDTGLLRGVDEAPGDFGAIVVGRAVLLVVQVMKLANCRVAGLEHLEVEQGSDGADLVGSETREEEIHHLAPAPETVRRSRSRPFPQSRHGPLEGMTVEIGHPRNGRSRKANRSGRCGCAGVHGLDHPFGVDGDQDIIGPAVDQHRGRRVKDGMGHVGSSANTRRQQ